SNTGTVTITAASWSSPTPGTGAITFAVRATALFERSILLSAAGSFRLSTMPCRRLSIPAATPTSPRRNGQLDLLHPRPISSRHESAELSECRGREGRRPADPTLDAETRWPVFTTMDGHPNSPAPIASPDTTDHINPEHRKTPMIIALEATRIKPSDL